MLERIGKYQIRKEIGHGAMGTVYEGYDSGIGRRVAIKTLRTEVFGAEQLPEVIARFRREASAAGRLSHPRIVTIYELGEERGVHYIVMEFLSGTDLNVLLGRGVRLPLEQIVRIASELLDALAAAHDEGVVHRDVKPANLFVLQDGSLKVVDFGIVHVPGSTLTQVAQMLGTPSYMAPEQWESVEVDRRCDLFSAGVILYLLLTGEKPFDGESIPIIMKKVLGHEPAPPSAVNMKLSPVWDAVLERALAKKPEARYQTAREFRAAVERAYAEERAAKEAGELARREAEARARAETEARAKREAERVAKEEVEAQRAAEERAEREAEARRSAEERARREAEERTAAEARVRKEAEEKARMEAERKARADAGERAAAAALAKKEAEERARREEEESAQREADARAAAVASARKEAAERARRAAEERAAAEARVRKEAEEKAQMEAEREARADAGERAAAAALAKRGAEERARREAEERMRLEAMRREEEARRKAEETVAMPPAARSAPRKPLAVAFAVLALVGAAVAFFYSRDETEKRPADAEESRLAAQRVQEAEKGRKEAEGKAEEAKRETERLAASQAEERARAEAERVKKEAEEKAKAEIVKKEEEAKRKVELAATAAAELQARKEADAKAKAEADERARAEAKARVEAEERAKAEAAKKAEEVRQAARKPGTVFQDCPDCPRMVVIPAGEFSMGSPASEAGRDTDEGPVHRVSIGQPFALGRNEVTVAQFRRFVDEAGYKSEAERNVGGQGCRAFDKSGKWDWQSGRSWRDPGFAQSDAQPVVCISWNDARAYVEWLSRKTEKRYRLPAEAEWEYAARAGTTTARYWGENADEACAYANVADQTTHEGRSWSNKHNCNDGHWFPAPVGSYKPNRFGLYDMLGNVWEWTEDCGNGSYTGAPSDGSAWLTGNCSQRVDRGGSWNNFPRVVRSALRLRLTSDDRSFDLGFRVARTLE